MDPINRIDIAGDTTFAILLEAQARGHDIFYYTPDNLALDGKHLIAHGYTLHIKDDPVNHFSLSSHRTQNLAQVDTILLRQDPPFDMAYITTTYLLERIHPKTLVVNDPSSIRNSPEKLFVLDFLDLMPPTMITRAISDVYSFRKLHGDIVIKPLYGNGGAAVFQLGKDDTNINSLIEMFQLSFREPFIVQKYCNEILEGDKRIILVDGEVAGAINRVPCPGEFRSNIHVGGCAEYTELTARDLEICERLRPELKKRGLLLTGIDVIGPYLTEINVTSPTGIREVKSLGGKDIASMFWDAIEKKLLLKKKVV